MKTLRFSLHNAILEQIEREDMIFWARKETDPYLPKYEKVKMKFTPAVIASFTRNFFRGLRP